MNRRRFIGMLAAGAVAALAPGFICLPKGRQDDGLLSNGNVLRKGDIFTIEGRFATNPVTGQPTAHLQLFTVTGDVDEGATHIPIELVHPTPPARGRVRPAFAPPLKPRDRGWQR